MKRRLQQIRAIVRANEAEFGRGVVKRDAMTMLLGVAAIAVVALDLLALGAVLGGGHG